MLEKIKLSNYGFHELQIETKAACNMACGFCPYPLKSDKDSVLEIEQVKQVIDQISSNDEKFRYVTFSQFNEPLLDNRIFDIIEHAQKNDLKVNFVTNGLLLNKEKNISELVRLKPDIKISLQIIEMDKHFKGRGLNMDLIRYSKTIFDFCKKIKDENIKVSIDIGCNLNDNKFKFLLKKVLGFQTGDPSIINNKKQFFEVLEKFINEMSKINDEYFFNKKKFKFKNFKESKIDYLSDYWSQEGLKIDKNITIKIKPFFYGRRINEFEELPSKSFACYSEILGILADGSIVPCCLAYDDKISLGNVKNFKLKEILNNNQFIKNLRSINGKKHEVCRKCFGEPTKRGVIFRSIYNQFKRLISD